MQLLHVKMSEKLQLWPWGVALPLGAVGWWLFRRPGRYFTWQELTTTNTGLANVPSLADRLRLMIMARQVLDPLREVAGPLTVTSAFRSGKVNEAVDGAGGDCHGGPGCSQHTVGYGVDVVPHDMTADQLAGLIRSGGAGDLPLYQVIGYSYTNHLHLGFNPGWNPETQTGDRGRTQYKWKTRSGYEDWSP